MLGYTGARKEVTVLSSMMPETLRTWEECSPGSIGHLLRLEEKRLRLGEKKVIVEESKTVLKYLWVLYCLLQLVMTLVLLLARIDGSLEQVGAGETGPDPETTEVKELALSPCVVEGG